MSVSTGNNVNATLDLLIDGIAINLPFESQGYGGGAGTITVPVSGNYLMDILPGQTVQLKISSFVGATGVQSPTISFFKVANLSV